MPTKPNKKLMQDIEHALQQVSKGYRSNPVLDSVRPNVHEKQKWFLSMEQSEVMYGGAAGGGKCLTPDHDVLVFGRGWLPIAEVKPGDLVASANETGIGSWETVAQTYSYRFKGKLRTSVEGAKFRATPNHKWRSRWESGLDARAGTSRSAKWRWHDATELKPNMKLMAVGDTYELSKPFFKTEEEAELFGWWLSEGSGFINGRTRISQTKTIGRDRIRKICKILKLDTKEYEYEFRPKWIPPVSGTDCYNKFIPKNILFSASAKYILRGLLGGDGYLRRKGWEYSSSSKQLAEDVQTLATLLGFRATIKLKKVASDKPHWLVAAYPRSTWSISNRALGWEAYDGPVYCLEVPTTSQFLVRHNGHIHVTGNSDALLMAALQYIDVPGYAAIMFRNTFADLALAGALMSRANDWLDGIPGMRKHDGGKKWSYQGGGTLEFAYLANDGDRYRYKSAEFQTICFDELTTFPEEDYKYLFSRLRKPSDAHCMKCFKNLEESRTKPAKRDCRTCAGTGFNPLSRVPLRMLSATNPGGKYGEWVKKHFITKEFLKATDDEQFSNVWVKRGKCLLCSGQQKIEVRGELQDCPACDGTGKTDRHFIPAKLEDNPAVDHPSYEKMLAQLTPVERAQLRSGRWDFVAQGNLFQSEWIRNYVWRGEHIELLKPEGRRLIENTMQTVFLTADTASKVRTVNDPSVICAWKLCLPTYELCLLEVIRDRILIPFILPEIIKLKKKWDAQFTIIEEASSGYAIIQEATLTEAGEGMTIMTYVPHSADKVSRSEDAQMRMKAGQIFFPITDDDQIAECLNEMLQFPDAAHDDFVDNLTMAAWYASGKWRTKSASPGGPTAQIRRGMPAPVRYNRY